MIGILTQHPELLMVPAYGLLVRKMNRKMGFGTEDRSGNPDFEKARFPERVLPGEEWQFAAYCLRLCVSVLIALNAGPRLRDSPHFRLYVPYLQAISSTEEH